MHAERILSVTNELISDATETKYLELLGALIAAVDKRITQPDQPNFDQAVSNAATKLFENLENSRTQTFTPTWRKLIQELGLSVLLSENIRKRVDEAFQIRLVDSNLKTSLEELKREITDKHRSLAQIQQGFQSLGIKGDELDPDELELNIVMPRKSIDDQLSGFKKELDELDKQLRVISSICKNDVGSFKIRSISTNDFSFSLDINIDLADVLLYVLVYLHVARTDFVKKMEALETDFSDLPRELLDSFKKFARDTTKRKISEVIEEMEKGECDQAVDSSKLSQQKGPVSAALYYLAKLLERGFNIDVRVGEPPEEEAPEEGQTEGLERLRTRNERLRAIGRKAAELRVIERQSEPILSIEDSSSDDGPSDGEPRVDESTEDNE